MRLAISIAVLSAAILAVLSALILPPPLTPPPSPEGFRPPTARHFLSDLAEAGKRRYSGSCADCHGSEGRGGSAPRLDTMAFARDFARSRDLHDAVGANIPAHAPLDRGLRALGAKQRFNDIEMMGKYLREARILRLRKAEN